MTAVNVVVGRDEVHVITDGAAGTADDRLRMLTPKVWPIPHADCVIAGRGKFIAMQGFLATALRYGHYDDLRAAMDRGKIKRLWPFGSLQVTVAGITRAGRASAFMYLWGPAGGDTHPTNRVIDIPSVM